MAFSINSSNLFSSRSINQAQDSQNKAFQRLSTFLRINSAKDDPAGSAIYQRQTAQIRGSDQAIRNANDGISFAQIAQGGLSQVTSNLQRIRELTVQASNSIVGNRDVIQAEINQLSEENSRIGETTSFGKQSVFPSGGQTVSFQVGADSDSNNQINVGLNSLENLNAVSSNQGASGIDVSSAAAAQASLDKIDADLESVSQQASSFGAIENRFGATISNLEEFSINTQAARSRIGDADIAKEVSNLIQAQLKKDISIALASQANQSQKSVLSLLGGGAR